MNDRRNPWDQFRAWLHRRGLHRLCRVVEEDRRVVDHYDYGKEWLVGTNPDGSELKLDITTFGGRPVYITKKVRVHT
jgi:hypothetical protein